MRQSKERPTAFLVVVLNGLNAGLMGYEPKRDDG